MFKASKNSVVLVSGRNLSRLGKFEYSVWATNL